MFDGDDLAAATGGRLWAPGRPGPVWTDTRTLPDGAWFLALVGPRFDGHNFVVPELASRVAGVVVERPLPGWSAGLIQVPDTTRAYADIGRLARSRLRVPVVGVTGSSGKTTTRTLVALALSPLGLVHQTGANLNNHLGVPMTLLATPEHARAVVVEMGTSGPGEIAHLADVARPSHRLIVNVGPAHLEELGSLQGVAVEKGALFRSASPGDVVLVNVDDPLVRTIPVPAGVRRVGYGSGADAEVRLESDELDASKLRTTFVVSVPEVGRVHGAVPAFGRHFAHNAAAAIAVAWTLGVDPAEAAAALAGYEPVGMRQRAVRLPGGALVLNDAYNANPTSTRASLEALAGLGGQRIAALGDMLELGVEEIRLHREVLEYALSLGLDRVLVVGPRFAEAARGLIGVECFERASDAARALGTLGAADAVLVKGSRGMAMEQLLQNVQGEAR